MVERDIPYESDRQPLGGAPVVEEDPGGHRDRFTQLETLFERGELTRHNEDGTTTPVVSYQRYIDPLDKDDLSTLSEFRLRAAALGFREAFAPITLATAATLDPRDREAVTNFSRPNRPLTVVQLGYEKSAGQRAPKQA